MGNFLSEFLLDVGIQAIRASQAAEKMSRSELAKAFRKQLRRLKKQRQAKKQPYQPIKPRTPPAAKVVDVNDPESVKAAYGEDAFVAIDENGQICIAKHLTIGYDAETKIYHYGDEKYQDGDIIWNDLQRGTTFCPNIFPEITPELTPISVRHLDPKHPRLPLDADYARVYREAKDHGCPTYAIVCRHGHFNVFVLDFYDSHNNPYYLVKVHNIAPCGGESPRLYAPLSLEIDNFDSELIYVRYAPGCSISWDKEVADYFKTIEESRDYSLELYKLGAGPNPDLTPYDLLEEPLDLPPEEPKKDEETSTADQPVP